MNRLLLLFLVLIAIVPVCAQTEGTLYFMNSLPQVVINNPAFVPKYKFSFGLPGISSVAVGYYNNGFSYNDLITKSNGEVSADLSKWVKSLTAKNYITSTAQVDVLRFGFRINSKLYVQANMTAHEYARIQLPKGFTALFVNGTAPLVGTNTSFSPQAEGLAYVESALGAAYQIDEKLTVGARFKYLSGVANVTTVSSNVNISVGSDYQMTASGDLNLKTSGIQNNGKDLRNFRSNNGYGIDLGATYKLTDRLTLAASIVDFGKITWRNNPYAYTLDKNTASYSFSGIDLKEVINGNSSYVHAQTDSIRDRFKPQESTIGSYSTWLPGKMFVSGNYELSRNLNVGAVLFTEKFQGRVSSGGSASLVKHFGKLMSTSVSYTVSNRSYNNVGAGLSFNFAPVQLYIVGDNLLRIPGSLITTGRLNSYINSTQVFNLRFGLNLVWGWDKGKDRLPRNTKPYNNKQNGSGKEVVTEGDSKAISGKPKKTGKVKATSGNPNYLKVRKKKG